MGTSTGKSHELSKAKRVVTATMKLKMAKLLFNQPVDPEALGLPNYFDVVKKPMDLGTVLSRLSDGELQEWEKCVYQNAQEVYRDVSLVWHNCALYNSREVDKPTRDAAFDVKAIFEQNWQEAGLSSVSEEPVQPKAPVEFVPESALLQSVGTVQGAVTAEGSVAFWEWLLRQEDVFTWKQLSYFCMTCAKAHFTLTHLFFCAEGLSVPLRTLEAYMIVQASTGKAADLIQAWSTPLIAQGDTVVLDGKGKSEFSLATKQYLQLAWVDYALIHVCLLFKARKLAKLTCRAEEASSYCYWLHSGLELYLWR